MKTIQDTKHPFQQSIAELFSVDSLPNVVQAYFLLLLCSRALELLTNSQGRDFMSQIGLVQAAMKVVDKISKSNA